MIQIHEIRALSPSQRFERACYDGYLLFGAESDSAFQRWGELAIRGRFPLVTASPQENGQAWVVFALEGHGRAHQVIMHRARRAIASVSQVFEEKPQQVSSVLMPMADAFKLAHKLARLTGYEFPVSESLLESLVEEVAREAS